MKKHLCWLSLLLCLLPAVPVWAVGLVAQDPWVREGPPSMQTLAAYMTIRNTGLQAQTVVGASSPLFAKVEFHESLQQGNLVTMVARDSLRIEAGGQIVLAPGGYHMMLIAPQGNKALRAGDKIPLLLHLSDGSQWAVEAEMRAVQPSAVEEHQHMHMH